MSGFYLRLMLLPFVLFSLTLLLSRTQPYDDQQLRLLLPPAGCPAPCFMGIRPGVTMLDEALKVLDSSGWVQTDHPESNDGGRETTMRFKWTGKQPDVINSRTEFALEYSNSAPKTITLIGFQLQLAMKLGTVHQTLGNPSGFLGTTLRSVNNGLPQTIPLIFDEYYESYHIELMAFLACPVDPAELLNATGVWVLYYGELKPNMILRLSESNFKAVIHTPYCQ